MISLGLSLFFEIFAVVEGVVEDNAQGVKRRLKLLVEIFLLIFFGEYSLLQIKTT